MSSIYNAPKGKGTGVTSAFMGIGVSALLFLLIPLTQIFNKYDKNTEEIQAVGVAPPPPPPPPPEEPPPPPEPEQEEPPPELDTPPPPISLDQLNMALNPGTGGNLSGDMGLPNLSVTSDELGGLDIFELGDVDTPPKPRTPPEFKYPPEAKRKNVRGVLKIEYVVNEKGRVEDIKVTDTPDQSLVRPNVDALRRLRFDPATKGGAAVKVRMRVSIPFPPR